VNRLLSLLKYLLAPLFFLIAGTLLWYLTVEQPDQLPESPVTTVHLEQPAQLHLNTTQGILAIESTSLSDGLFTLPGYCYYYGKRHSDA